MQSSLSRRRLASSASTTRAGLTSRPTRPCASQVMPNLVAITACRRSSPSADASTSSEWPNPYTSAVSNRLMPRSRARRIAAADSRSSTGPQPWPPIAQPPKPTRETSRSVKASFLYSIARDDLGQHGFELLRQRPRVVVLLHVLEPVPAERAPLLGGHRFPARPERMSAPVRWWPSGGRNHEPLRHTTPPRPSVLNSAFRPRPSRNSSTACLAP